MLAYYIIFLVGLGYTPMDPHLHALLLPLTRPPSLQTRHPPIFTSHVSAPLFSLSSPYQPPSYLFDTHFAIPQALFLATTQAHSVVTSQTLSFATLSISFFCSFSNSLLYYSNPFCSFSSGLLRYPFNPLHNSSTLSAFPHIFLIAYPFTYKEV